MTTPQLEFGIDEYFGDCHSERRELHYTSFADIHEPFVLRGKNEGKRVAEVSTFIDALISSARYYPRRLPG